MTYLPIYEARKVLGDLVEAELETVQKETGEDPNLVGELRARAERLAEEFIEQCGFDRDDSDQSGEDMEGSVMAALVFAFLRIGVDDVEGGVL